MKLSPLVLLANFCPFSIRKVSRRKRARAVPVGFLDLLDKPRAGLEGFEPPTPGLGNLHTREWVCLSPELWAILVRGDSLSQQLVCQFSNFNGSTSNVSASLQIVLGCTPVNPFSSCQIGLYDTLERASNPYLPWLLSKSFTDWGSYTYPFVEERYSSSCCSAALSTSWRVMRPPEPVPSTTERSTPSSVALRVAAGVAFTSLSDSTPASASLTSLSVCVSADVLEFGSPQLQSETSGGSVGSSTILKRNPWGTLRFAPL